ncbi:hypothetical protein DQ04_02001040 [Trypanosoma grayi]|uniref:hypothetical protein n=1 Tax=Trypanosoma grayi TaxID=71804 RepID=UPI0004F403BB|nr:hypothetical protein DQ04_02001040 [Trypanosoma grayi]KEG12101.1 hypothetical protein DQ04_02001040 [Trypanosoma grayi]
MRANIFSRLFERVAAVPHRSVTAVPYSEWFGLYVAALRAARGDGKLQPNSADLNAARLAVDVALLSSVVSQSWADVVLPKDGISSGTSAAAGWWQENTVAAWLNPSQGIRGRELVTTPFLVETLLSSRAISSWTEAVREGGAAPNTAEKEDTREQKQKHEEEISTVKDVVLLPFTALFQLRCEAHPNPQSAVNREQQQSLLSLQERTARLSVLYLINHLMDLQTSSDRRAHVEFAVWSPVNEFDAIMQLSRVRQSLPEPVRSLFSLAQVCEHETVRTAYLAHYLSLSTRGAPLTLLAPQAQQTALRKLGAAAGGCLKEQSACVKERRRRGVASTNASLHKRAVKSCEKLVRRMSAREENLRHILIP